MQNMQKGHEWMRFSGMIGLLSSLALIPSACTRKDQAPENVRIEDIKENPSAYLGKSVTVSGEIESVYGPRAFQLGGRDFFDSEIRVVTTQPLKDSVRRQANQPFAVDDIALVTGTVRNIVVADVEREFSFDLDPNYEIELENKPAIIATSVLISPRGRETTSATVAAESASVNDLQAILSASDKLSLVGKDVQLERVQVQSVVGDQSFWIGPSANQLVFVTFAELPTPGTAKEGQVAIKSGQRLSLKGTIRSMPALSDDWLKQNSLDQKAGMALKAQPIYIQARDIVVEGSAG
jgi:hypothetical protein